MSLTDYKIGRAEKNLKNDGWGKKERVLYGDDLELAFIFIIYW